MRLYTWRWRHSAAVAVLCVLALAGCGGMTTYYKTVATNAVASKGAYLALDTADELKQTDIRAHASADPAKARHDFTAWTATYDKARKALDAHSDLVIGAMREGPALEAALNASKEISKWLTALTIAGAAVAQTLQDAGISWQSLLTGGK